ncbi:ROK family protein [Streptomyces iconiensis]|uniref:ROK family protein n=1 Tax=Streptomyces iconiensis TaxID=1384038 RepID=A0ABT7A7R9_9ACTN|nr:ROK family protein [Streptomyces iconiensis]MDJ1137377.1 ROK family protein [Streptomyces iconiensis]
MTSPDDAAAGTDAADGTRSADGEDSAPATGQAPAVGSAAVTESVVLALDVGGTKIAGGLVGPDGTVVHRTQRPTPLRPVPAVAEAAAELMEAASARGLTVRGAGAGFPEYVTADGRLTSSEVIDWDEQPASVLARTLPGVPVRIDSDVRCGARGEALWGAGAALPGFLYVSLGTGLSSALVLEGRPVPGHRGEAIAFGELGVPVSVDPTWQGNLERYASGRGMGERRGVAGAREVTALAAAGDAEAAHVLDSAGRALATTLVWLVRLLDPAAVVLGGGLGCAPVAALHTPLAETWHKALAATGRPAPPPLRTARTGQESGLLGAAALVR